MADESAHAKRPKSSSKKRFSFVSSGPRTEYILSLKALCPRPSLNTTAQKEADDDVAAFHTTKKGFVG